MDGDRSKKLIAFVSNSAWSVTNFRLDVIRSLVSAGHRILVFAPPDEYVADLELAGCSFHPIIFNNKTANPYADWMFYRQLKRLYNLHQPDFIFHYVAKPNIYGSFAAGGAGIPSVAVITGLGYPFAKKNWLFYLVKFLYRHALKHATGVWFLNNEDARVFVDEKIVEIAKMKVLPGEGINTRHFSRIPGATRHAAFTFVMSTRLLKSKGILIFADAARILRKKQYDVRFELIGFFESFHPDSITETDIQQWQQEGLISYKGFARDVRPYLSRAHCLIFPSFYREGIPRCLMEAAAMELPVITCDARGCRDVVVNNQTGYLCRSRDAFDLADKMEMMLNLPDKQRLIMGAAGRRLVMEKFDMQHITQEYFHTLQIDLTD